MATSSVGTGRGVRPWSLPRVRADTGFADRSHDSPPPGSGRTVGSRCGSGVSEVSPHPRTGTSLHQPRGCRHTFVTSGIAPGSGRLPTGLESAHSSTGAEGPGLRPKNTDVSLVSIASWRRGPRTIDSPRVGPGGTRHVEAAGAIAGSRPRPSYVRATCARAPSPVLPGRRRPLPTRRAFAQVHLAGAIRAGGTLRPGCHLLSAGGEDPSRRLRSSDARPPSPSSHLLTGGAS